MSFEEATQLASVIAVGRVLESPEYGTSRGYPDGTSVVVRQHRFRVEEYLKGEGPMEITIETLGGKFIREVNGKQEELYQVSGGQPQLPEDGTEILVFLTPFGGPETFMICSASHGVVPVESVGGEKIVRVALSDSEVMPPAVLESHRRVCPEGSRDLHGTIVPMNDLRLLIEKVLAPRPRPTQPPRRENSLQ